MFAELPVSCVLPFASPQPFVSCSCVDPFLNAASHQARDLASVQARDIVQFILGLCAGSPLMLRCFPAAIMNIVLSQRCGIILVGDPHQQIYTFRGAVNTLCSAPHTHVYYLTQVR